MKDDSVPVVTSDIAVIPEPKSIQELIDASWQEWNFDSVPDTELVESSDLSQKKRMDGSKTFIGKYFFLGN